MDMKAKLCTAIMKSKRFTKSLSRLSKGISPSNNARIVTVFPWRLPSISGLLSAHFEAPV